MLFRPRLTCNTSSLKCIAHKGGRYTLQWHLESEAYSLEFSPEQKKARAFLAKM